MAAPSTHTDSADAGALTIGPVRRLVNTRAPGRRCAAVLIWLLISLGPLERSLPDHPASKAFLISLMIGPWIGLLWWMHRKAAWASISWRLDEEGVLHSSSVSESRSLRWADLDAIRPSEDSIGLRSGDERLAIPLNIPGSDRAAILAFVRSRLPAGFDLDARPRPFGPIGPFLRRIAWAILGTLLFVATAAAPALIPIHGGPRIIAWIGIIAIYAWIWIACEAAIRYGRRADDAIWQRRRDS